jgi:hypothetical protein
MILGFILGLVWIGGWVSVHTPKPTSTSRRVDVCGDAIEKEIQSWNRK